MQKTTIILRLTKVTQELYKSGFFFTNLHQLITFTLAIVFQTYRGINHRTFIKLATYVLDISYHGIFAKKWGIERYRRWPWLSYGAMGKFEGETKQT